MSRVDDVIQIFTEVTGETPEEVFSPNMVNFNGADYKVIIVALKSEGVEPLYDPDYFQVVLFAEDIDLLEAKRPVILRADSRHPSGYKYTHRVSFTVDDASAFAVGDTLTDQTSAATGEIYKIATNVVYLHTVVGVFGNGNTVSDGADTAVLATAETNIEFPEWIEFTKREKDIDRKYYSMLLDARWTM